MSKEEGFYKKLRTRILDWVGSERGKQHKWADYLLLAPDLFYTLWKLSLDPEVPTEYKLRLAAVIAYFISPLDLMPEAVMGPAGFIDDVVLTAMTLNFLLNHVPEEVVRRHWPGDDDVLDVIRTILAKAEEIVGTEIFQGLRRVLMGRKEKRDEQ